MFFIKLIRFFKGYVNFVCTGGFPERFINLCNVYGITLRNTKTDKNSLSASTDINSFRKIKPCVKNSGMRIRITKKGGLPFILNRYTRRKGLFAGIVASIILIAYLNNFIWITEVRGNNFFTENQITEICREYGVFSGARKKDIDVSAINKQIKNDYENISWFALNIYGLQATLEVSERTDKTNIYDKNTPCNIVSGEDGVVLELITLSGTPQIKTGSAVTDGDILISGVIEKTDGSQKFVHARGSAKIRTNKTITSETQQKITVTKRTDKKICYELNFFGIKIPLHFSDISPVEKYTYSLSFRDKLLPVSVTKKTVCSLSTENISLSQQQSTLLTCYNSAMQEKNMMENAEIEKKVIKIENRNTSTVITAEYTIHKSTGFEKFFEVSME